jgi:hypothetical protein
MLLGSAGTGKSRTLRSFVTEQRRRTRREWEGQLLRARLGARGKAEARAARAEVRQSAEAADSARNVAEMLGVPAEEAAAAAAAFAVVRERSAGVRGGRAAGADDVPPAVAELTKKIDERVANSCLLAAPTGCASFQLKFGASTLHLLWPLEEPQRRPLPENEDANRSSALVRDR